MKTIYVVIFIFSMMLFSCSPETQRAELQKIDGAGLQLLVTFFAEANKLQKDISWIDTSGPLIDAAKLLGVTSLLKLDEQAV